jgi:hypothetical protein
VSPCSSVMTATFGAPQETDTYLMTATFGAPQETDTYLLPRARIAVDRILSSSFLRPR